MCDTVYDVRECVGWDILLCFQMSYFRYEYLFRKDVRECVSCESVWVMSESVCDVCEGVWCERMCMMWEGVWDGRECVWYARVCRPTHFFMLPKLCPIFGRVSNFSAGCLRVCVVWGSVCDVRECVRRARVRVMWENVYYLTNGVWCERMCAMFDSVWVETLPLLANVLFSVVKLTLRVWRCGYIRVHVNRFVKGQKQRTHGIRTERMLKL